MPDEYLMNVGSVELMAEEVSKKAAEYLRIIDETTAIVDGLSVDWEGQTYQTFKEGYYAHLKDLEELNNSLVTLAGELYDKAEGTRNTINAAKAILR